MQETEANHRSLYELVLSNSLQREELKKVLDEIVKLTIHDHTHFQFLFYRINWFSSPYIHVLSGLERAVRLYRGKGKQAAIVGYNLLIDGLWQSTASKPVVECLGNLFNTLPDSQTLLRCLKDNYPHKCTPVQTQEIYLQSLLSLCRKIPQFREQLLEIVFEKLVQIDTELRYGDIEMKKLLPQDTVILKQRQEVKDEESKKLDRLLCRLMEYCRENQNDQTFFKQILLIFKNILLKIDGTKNLQLIIFYLAQQNKSNSKMFITFLLGIILQGYKRVHLMNNKKQQIQCHDYLASYIYRSKIIGLSKVKGVLQMLMKELLNRISSFKDQKSILWVNLDEILQNNYSSLLMLQTILRIVSTNPATLMQIVQPSLPILYKKLYYTYFIKEQMLNSLKIPHTTHSNAQCLPSYQKFNPTILPDLSRYLDFLMKLKESQPAMDDTPRKRVKREECGISEGDSQTHAKHYT